MYKNRKDISIIAFHCWLRKNFAIFSSLHKVIRICPLLVTYSILVLPGKAHAQEYTDTLQMKNHELNEVVITAGRTPVGAQQVARLVTTVTGPEIERAPSPNISDLLRYIPSADIRQRGPFETQADISIRGGTYDQTLILLNGVNITDPQTGHHNLNLPVDPESIERIEILQGPAAKTFGPNAFNGAINLITGNSYKNRIRVSGSAGQYGLFNTSMNISNTRGHFSHFFSAGHSSSEGYTHNTDFSHSTLFYQAEFKDPKGITGFQAGYQARNFGANSFYSLRYPDQFEAIKTSFFSLKYESNTRLKFSPVLYLRRNRDRFELIRNNDMVPFNHHLSTVAGMNLNLWTTYRNWKTSLGFDFRNEYILSNLLGNQRNKFIKVPGYDSVFYTRSYNRLNTSFYAEQSLTGSRLNINAGIMVHHNTGLSGFRIYPGLDISYRLMGYSAFYASVNKTLRMPTFTDMFYKSPVQQGNPALKPEEAVTAEGGFRFNYPVWKGHVSAFRRWGYDMIDWVKDPSADSIVWRSRNYSSIRMTGLEGSLNIVPTGIDPTGRIQSAGISYTFLHAGADQGYLLSKYAFDYLKRQFIASVDFRAAWKLYGSIRLTWRDRNGSYQDAEGKITKYQPFWLADVKIILKSRHFNLFTAVSNILNTRYFDFGGIRQPGFWVNAGISVNWDYKK